MGINLGSTGGGTTPTPGTAADTFTIVEYTGSWPPRPTLPAGYAVMWINRVNNTAPPSGVGGYVIGLDVALLALP